MGFITMKNHHLGICFSFFQPQASLRQLLRDPVIDFPVAQANQTPLPCVEWKVR